MTGTHRHIVRRQTQRTPRTRPAGQGDDAAVLALEAFDAGAALVDITNQRLLWCSPGFASRCCVSEGEDLQALELRLPGLAQALGQLARPAAMLVSSDADAVAPRASWRLAEAVGTSVAEAALVRPGVAALRLRSDGDGDGDGDAAQRALAVTEMVSSLTHELHQPLGIVANVLRGLHTRLERQAANEDLQGGVQFALEQVLSASRIVARLRDDPRAHPPRHEALDLGGVVGDALSLLDREIRREGVRVEFAQVCTPCLVAGDEVLLQQLFVNLLRDWLQSMREHPTGAPVRARRHLMLALAVERGMAVLTLRENGGGSPTAPLRSVAPILAAEPGALGLGLHVCRTVVELHQGRLWFGPGDADGGRTVHVALPLLAHRPPQAPGGL